jgi:hypothetical protein
VAVGAGRLIQAVDTFRETYIHAALILAFGFAVIMALHPRLGLNPRHVWVGWLVFALCMSIYGLWRDLTGRGVPVWLTGFALGWMFSTLVPDKPRKRR